MEQRYFEQRAMLGGMAPGAGLFDGYRKGNTVNVGLEDSVADAIYCSRCPAREDILRRPALGRKLD